MLAAESRSKPSQAHSSASCRLFKVNEKGSVPIVKDLEADKWYIDSADFVNFLEDKYPEPKLGKADSAPDV